MRKEEFKGQVNKVNKSGKGDKYPNQPKNALSSDYLETGLDLWHQEEGKPGRVIHIGSKNGAKGLIYKGPTGEAKKD